MLIADMPACAWRRSAFLATLAAAGLLTGCGSDRPDPQSLVGEAVRATQALHSVAFKLEGHLTADLSDTALDGTVTANGAMTDDGKTLGARVTFEGKGGQSQASQPVTIEGEIAYAAQGEVVVRLDSVTGNGLAGLLSPSLQPQLLKRWLRVVEGSTGTLVTPEPQLLTAEAEALEVTEDMGDETIDEVTVAHYGIRLNPAKLKAYLERAESGRHGKFDAAQADVTANGEIWIDPETALVHRLQWVVTKNSAPSYGLDFTLNLLDHNAAEPAVTPTNVVDIQQAILQAVVPATSSSSSSSPDAPDA